jgi:hypothetical protein
LFTTEAQTARRELVDLVFQVAGQVHTASFVLDAASATPITDDDTDDEGDHGGH